MSAMLKDIQAAALDSVIEQESVLAQRFLFPQHFVGFQGHFPDMPVLPAIAQLLTAASVIRAHTGRNLRIAAVSKAKFLLPVKPGMEITVSATPRPGDDASWSVKLQAGPDLAASFILSLAAPAEDRN